LKYRKLHGWKYMLTEEFSVFVGLSKELHTDYIILSDGILIIRKGYSWDGASGGCWDTKTVMRGSLVHDALYQLLRLGLLQPGYRKIADRLLRMICLEDGMNRFRAAYIYWAVRIFAGYAAKKARA
jgi:hypothetical protein